jgi:hypothetical protein
VGSEEAEGGVIRVAIESPCNAPTHDGIEDNLRYARRCMLDSLRRGEAPYASHLLYTQVLDDLDADERRQGMRAGATWTEHAEIVAVYADRGVSSGMQASIDAANARGQRVEMRLIGEG